MWDVPIINNGLPDIYTGEEVMGMPASQIDYWVDIYVPKKGKILALAKPKVGKTHFVLQMSVHAVDGRPFLGNACEPCKVLYICLDPMLLTSLIQRVSQGIPASRLQNLKLVKWDWSKGGLYLDTGQNVDILKQLIDVVAPDIVVLDPKVATMSGDENTAKDNEKWMNTTYQLQQNYPISLVIVHHIPKTPSNDITDWSRGSGALPGWADVIIGLKRNGAGQRTLEFISRYTEQIDSIDLDFNGYFSLSAAYLTKLNNATKAVEQLWGTMSATDLVKQVSTQQVISLSYAWRAYKLVKDQRAKSTTVQTP
jgi:hypothetical protein